MSDDSRKSTNPKDAVAGNKLPLHMVSPFAKAYLSIAAFLGATKYGSWNWRVAGVKASVYRSALDRHVDAWWEGEEDDPTDGTPHLANALACLVILIEAQHARRLVDDRPPSLGAELVLLRARLEALMPEIRTKYAHLDPRHYTLEDTVK